MVFSKKLLLCDIRETYLILYIAITSIFIPSVGPFFAHFSLCRIQRKIQVTDCLSKLEPIADSSSSTSAFGFQSFRKKEIDARTSCMF